MTPIKYLIVGLAVVSLTNRVATYLLPATFDVDTKAAIDLAEAMDASADPCQDFFQYACGGWIKKNPIPKSKSSWSQFDILNERLAIALKEILEAKSTINDTYPVNVSRQMYSTCMNTDAIEVEGLKPLTNYLAKFGGWPMTLNNWNQSSFDWRKAIASNSITYGMNLLITIYNDVDELITNTSSIHIDQGTLELSRSDLIDLDENEDTISAYRKLAIGSAKAIRDYLKSQVTNAQIESEVDAIIDFESQLATITVPDENRRNSTRMYNPMSLTELQNWTDSVITTRPQAKINWLDHLNSIYSIVNITIPVTEKVIIIETGYLKSLVELLDQTPPRVLANYIHWRMVDALATDSNKKMTDLQFEFSKVYEGVLQRNSRATKCIDKINDLFGYALGSVYVEKALSDEALDEVKVMITNLKRAFKSLIMDATWMDSITKAIAADKVDAMIEFVGYPKWIKNKTEIEDYYDGLLPATKSHFLNMQQAHANSNQLDLASLRDKIDRTEWNSHPTVVNAFYSGTTNSITFPAAILQSPYFAKGRTAAINYGAMGTMIGHEITHGFDDQGRQSDKFGKTVEWWTQNTFEKYQDRAKCFIDQYSNYVVLNRTKLNGINTQGENIADNGGLRESFRAYRYYVAANGVESTKFENLRPEQIFFLAYANSFCGTNTPEDLRNVVQTDPHSPYRYRVIGTLSNNEDFVREFKCAVGTPMNRLNKCVLW